MDFSLQKIEFILAILVRITGFVYTAPFFGLKNTPFMIKAGFSFILSIIVFNMTPYQPLEYEGVIGFALLMGSEILAGLILGFLANVVYQTLAFAGQQIDTEVGLSMVNEFDPVMSGQVTVTGTFYQYAVMLMLMVTYMHHYLLRALLDSYQVVPLGGVDINPGIYSVAVKYIIDYFIIAFRIVLPIFASMLVVNAILAILAKVAPQMNMFVIGVQIKVLVGLAVLLIMINLLPGISQIIFDEMMDLMRAALPYMGG